MSYLVVARKWRPQNFEDIAGQGHITRTLQNAIRSDRIAHAYLFTGVRGVGKTTAARVLAKALNCEQGPTPTPCNKCSICNEITLGTSIDVIEIDGASNRGIDEVRQIIENVRYQPAKCRFKVYVIDEVHQVTKDAFNALLKTLEEPPPSVKFVLATTEPHRLPETILSRCQRYDFRRIALREIVQRLGEIARSEGLSISDGALVLLAREADGSMRDAQSLLEQILASAAGGDDGAAVDESMLQNILGLAERRALYEISTAVLQGNPARCLELIAALVTDGRDLPRFSKDLVEHFRNLMVAKLAARGGAAKNIELLDLPDQEIADLTQQSQSSSIEALLDYYDFMAAGDESVTRSPNPRFALEAVLVRLATLPDSLPVAELLERIEGLERRLGGALPGSAPPQRPVSGPEPAQKLFSASPPGAAVTSQASAAAAPVVPAAHAPSGELDRGWPEFVQAVRREKKFLASHLDTARVLEMRPGKIFLGVGERLELMFLQDAENLAALKKIAGAVFGGETAIDVKLITEDAAPTARSYEGDGDAAATGEKSDMVKEALKIFGGSVRAVRRDGG